MRNISSTCSIMKAKAAVNVVMSSGTTFRHDEDFWKFINKQQTKINQNGVRKNMDHLEQRVFRLRLYFHVQFDLSFFQWYKLIVVLKTFTHL